MNNYDVRTVSRAEVDHLVKAHYLHKWPGVCVRTLGLFDGESAIGVIVFALPPRQTFVRYRVDLAWELARLFILDVTPKNTESWFISKAVSDVRNNRKDVSLLVSYADPSAGHSGTIYKACSWISDGRTDQERKTPRFDYSVNGKVYSRKAHVPKGADVTRVPRVSKPRFVFWLDGTHEKRRKALTSDKL